MKSFILEGCGSKLGCKLLKFNSLEKVDFCRNIFTRCDFCLYLYRTFKVNEVATVAVGHWVIRPVYHTQSQMRVAFLDQSMQFLQHFTSHLRWFRVMTNTSVYFLTKTRTDWHVSSIEYTAIVGRQHQSPLAHRFWYIKIYIFEMSSDFIPNTKSVFTCYTTVIRSIITRIIISTPTYLENKKENLCLVMNEFI